MELKKYFHNKILINLISVLIGAIIVSAFVATKTLEFYIVATYGFLFVVFAFGYQVIKATVRKVKSEKHKLNKEWGYIVLCSVLAIVLSLVAYYGAVTFYRVLATVLLISAIAVDYCLYRFVYLPKIFMLPKVRQEVLYFSWKLWGDMLDKGEEEKKVAALIIHAQTKCNSRLDSNAWGARFSKSKIYNEPVGEDKLTDSDVDILIDQTVAIQLEASALDIVHSYEKKN